jgi:hypothetical protein
MLHPLRERTPDDLPWLEVADQTPPPMDQRIGAFQPCQYSERMARIILARLERGDTVAQIVADRRFPSRRTLYDWLQRHADFGEAWAEVRRDIARSKRRRVAELGEGVQRWEAIRARAEGRAPRRKPGRKSTYTPQRGEAYCELIVQGFSTREASARPGMPAPAMVYRWLRNHPDFRELYLAAVEGREDLLADRVLEVAERVTPLTAKLVARRIKQLQRQIVDVRPDVWRWD